MKKLLKELQTIKDSDKIDIKRYFYDPLKPNHVENLESALKDFRALCVEIEE